MRLDVRPHSGNPGRAIVSGASPRRTTHGRDRMRGATHPKGVRRAPPGKAQPLTARPRRPRRVGGGRRRPAGCRPAPAPTPGRARLRGRRRLAAQEAAERLRHFALAGPQGCPARQGHLQLRRTSPSVLRPIMTADSPARPTVPRPAAPRPRGGHPRPAPPLSPSRSGHPDPGPLRRPSGRPLGRRPPGRTAPRPTDWRHGGTPRGRRTRRRGRAAAPGLGGDATRRR